MVRVLLTATLVGGIVANVRQAWDSEIAFAAACTAGTTGVPFTWEGAATGNKADWLEGLQDDGFSASYVGGVEPLTYDATLTVDDPDGINEDGNNPLREAYKGLFNWDPFLATKTNGAYGPGYLTVAIDGAQSGPDTRPRVRIRPARGNPRLSRR